MGRRRQTKEVELVMEVVCTHLVSRAGIKGVSAGKNHAAVTTRDGALTYTLKDRECAGNWAVAPGSKKSLTAASMVLDATSTLVTVRGGKVVCGSPRDDDEKELGSEWVAHAAATVETVLPISSSSTVFVVIMEDAQLCLCDSDPSATDRMGEMIRPSESAQTLSVVHSQIGIVGGTPTLALTLHGDATYWLCSVTLELDSLSIVPKGQVQLAPPPEHSASAATIQAFASHPASPLSCAAVWSSGHLCIYSAPQVEQWSEVLDWNSAVPLTLGPQPALTFVQPSALLSFGVTEEGCNSSEPNLAEARLWHTMFGTLYGGSSVPALEGLRSDEVLSVACGTSDILLYSTKSVWLLEVLNVPTLSLATAVGTHRQAGKRGICTVPASLHTVFDAPVPKSAKKKSSKNSAQSTGWTDADLCDAVETVGSSSEDKLIKHVKEYLGRAPHVPPQIIEAICERCCCGQASKKKSASTVHSPESLELVLEQKLVSGRLHPEVVARCLDARATKLLELALKNVEDIPEPELVRAVQVALSAPEDKQALLEGVVRAPSSRAPLLLAVRTLEISECDAMLGWLADQLEGGDDCAQLLEWMSVLLDAHYHGLLLSDDTHDTLVRCNSLVKQEVQLANSLCGLEAFRHLAQGERAVKPAAQVAEYSIVHWDL